MCVHGLLVNNVVQFWQSRIVSWRRKSFFVNSSITNFYYKAMGRGGGRGGETESVTLLFFFFGALNCGWVDGDSVEQRLLFRACWNCIICSWFYSRMEDPLWYFIFVFLLLIKGIRKQCKFKIFLRTGWKHSLYIFCELLKNKECALGLGSGVVLGSWVHGTCT